MPTRGSRIGERVILDPLFTRNGPVYVGNDRVLLKTANGYKMFVDARDISIAPHLILEGVYEEHTDAVLNSIMRPGMHVLEIGANVGLFTILMSHKTGSQGSVLAFECDPVLAQILRDNLELNGLAHIGRVDERAVTDRETTMRFFSARRHRGGGTLVEGLEQLPDMNAERVEIDVQTTTVDCVLERRERPFDFVKIDAEGAEPAIFRGGRTLFEDRSRPLRVMLEFAPAFFSRSGEDPARFLAAIEEFGFSIERIDDRRRSCVSTSRDALLAMPFADLLLTRH